MKIKDCTMLVVEDEFIAQEYLTQILHSFRVKEIFKASSANEALEIVREQQIDLVFMDINIEGAIDGIKCASLLNQQYFIPIIFTTAYADTDTINEVKEENVFGYLIKPFQFNNIEATLNVALSNMEKINKLKKTKVASLNIEKRVDLGKNYMYDLKSKTLTFCNNPINLTKKEFDFLDILAHNINTNISYEYIKETLWLDKHISDSTVRDIVSRLKKKVPHIEIKNISNYGYVLKQI